MATCYSGVVAEDNRMQWDIVGKVRAQIVTWTGQSFSGVRKDAHVSPIGGVTDPDGLTSHFKSFAIVAPYGTRVTLITRPGPEWQTHSWRCLHVLKPWAFKTPEGKPCLQCPDLEWMHVPNATRVQFDFCESAPQPATFEEGEGWTFGRKTDNGLIGNVRLIRLEYAPVG
jgi:hypothetical protein